jgi:hypothetical protein
MAKKVRKVNPNRAPLVEGSSLTVGQANRQAHRAARVRYGAAVHAQKQDIASSETLAKDTAGWYDAYLKELSQHRSNIAGQANAQNTAVQQLGQSAANADDARRREVDAQLQADAQTRGATVDPQLSRDAANGSSVRQAMFNSYGAMLAGQGRANTDYADTLAHVVAPGQKLQAQAQSARGTSALRSKLSELKGEKSAYEQSFLDSLTDSGTQERPGGRGCRGQQRAEDGNPQRDGALP